MFKKKIRKIIYIEGMSCNHCAKKVEEELNKINDVLKTKVNLTKKQAVITLNEDIDNSIIEETINNLEYKVIKIEVE